MASTRIAVLAEAKFKTACEVTLSERLLNIRAKLAPIISGPATATGKDNLRVGDALKRPCFSAIRISNSEIAKNSNAPTHAYGVTGFNEEEISVFIDFLCTRFRVWQEY